MLIEHLNRQLRERAEQALTRNRRTAASPCAPQQRVARDGQPAREMLAFCSNDYLGLANHPALTAALAEGAQRFGAGSGASHLVSGHSLAHARLEAELAAWMAPNIPNARALYFCTGYMANMALAPALAAQGATIFADRLNHASLVDGALLSKATLQRYAHRNLVVLERQLSSCDSAIKLIVTDAVFSMDGDLADLPAMLALAEKYDAWLVVDDAHGFGVLGAQGRGSLAQFGLCSERLIYMGTLGKAAGVAGAFIAAHPTIVEWLVQTARPYIYTTAAPPAIAHAVSASLLVLASEDGTQRRAHLAHLVALLRRQLTLLMDAHPSLGWSLADSHTAIQPLIVGDNAAALVLSAALERQGLWVPAIRPPTVPVGTARLRITLSASHSVHDVLRLVHGLAMAAQDMHV
ncbi:8-amino-7-oxononanoate synthase [Rhodoferax ferrireducens]|uniref:8-amino-7-oxononanoate synthase n=1 Tax=Rhodoferax ferrireducens TaxID=192843 RepID=A0ABU2CB27_9BURK|nr:8-amino-7-oxononanoate synthase [Rhodoferax ferrireducens]MDR7378518.1 8-amino-7-oxononanoate synthase [Rhodoferax ferrireducens]